VQDVLFVPSGFLSPDLMLVPRESARIERAFAMLVVEVSHTTRRRDEAKVALYAAARVPEYWCVDIEAAEVVVRRQPTADGYGTCAASPPARRSPRRSTPRRSTWPRYSGAESASRHLPVHAAHHLREDPGAACEPVGFGPGETIAPPVAAPPVDVAALLGR
jgi:hypothetical protein